MHRLRDTTAALEDWQTVCRWRLGQNRRLGKRRDGRGYQRTEGLARSAKCKVLSIVDTLMPRVDMPSIRGKKSHVLQGLATRIFSVT